MGIGDDIIATSMARGAADRDELVAFGDGKKILWGPYSEMVFRGNPNVARPGQEGAKNLKWVLYYKGHRIYNASSGRRWIWNYQFRVSPGELFLGPEELAERDSDLVLIEPNLPKKPSSANKEWPLERWKLLALGLAARGLRVKQFDYGGPIVAAERVRTPTFRHAAGLLRSARLAILPEGGLHHAAAAVGTRAVVLFGGFVPPSVLGYDGHVNLTGGATACGSFSRCSHCAEAMAAIRVDHVLSAVDGMLSNDEVSDLPSPRSH